MVSLLMQDWLAIHAGQTHPRFAATSIELRLHRGESRGKQDRLLVQTYIGRDRPVSPVVILCVPSVVAILMEERFPIHAMIALARLPSPRVILRGDRRIASGNDRRFPIQSKIGGSNGVAAFIVLQRPGVIAIAMQCRLVLHPVVSHASYL